MGNDGNFGLETLKWGVGLDGYGGVGLDGYGQILHAVCKRWMGS